MTIKVNIQNMDSREAAIIAVMAQNETTESGWVEGTEIELKGGASCEFSVHSAQVLTIREKVQ